ncbi:hypothetical protein HY612_05220 [Candidatus Roizmanbacteria bacterium]|nr:hypothetical protein [Candidatus Roizmanbacteria bacterium]
MLNIKKALVTGAISAAIIGTMVANVFAGAGKAPLYNAPANFTCPTGAQPAAGDPAFGFAVLNTTGSGWVIAEVALKGATPNSSYDIYVNQDPGGCPTIATGTLTTNGQGNGNANVKVPAVAGATAYWVSAVGGGQVLRSTAVASP